MIQELDTEKLKKEIYFTAKRLEREFPNYLNGAMGTVNSIIEDYESSKIK